MIYDSFIQTVAEDVIENSLTEDGEVRLAVDLTHLAAAAERGVCFERFVEDVIEEIDEQLEEELDDGQFDLFA